MDFYFVADGLYATKDGLDCLRRNDVRGDWYYFKGRDALNRTDTLEKLVLTLGATLHAPSQSETKTLFYRVNDDAHEAYESADRRSFIQYNVRDARWHGYTNQQLVATSIKLLQLANTMHATLCDSRERETRVAGLEARSDLVAALEEIHAVQRRAGWTDDSLLSHVLWFNDSRSLLPQLHYYLRKTAGDEAADSHHD